MSVSGKIQAQLGPMTTPNSIEFNQLNVAGDGKALDRDAEQQLEFHKLLQNSNADLARERAAKKTGDLSSAKTDEEFRKMLSEKANPKRTPKNQLGKDDFMKLFIAQMQSQDPLSPQDSSQMAAQMAQFNSLEQMMNVNKTLENMLQSQTTDRAISMVNYVGKEVDVGTGMLKWDKNKMTKTTFEVDQPLANAFVEVRDGSGQVIASKELGNLMPGEHRLKWDGVLKSGISANPGIYHFSVVGKSVEGQDVPIPIKSKVKITGVDLQSQGGAFFTELGKLAIKDVASVGMQGFDDNKPLMQTVEAPAASAPVAAQNNGEGQNNGSQPGEGAPTQGEGIIPPVTSNLQPNENTLIDPSAAAAAALGSNEQPIIPEEAPTQPDSGPAGPNIPVNFAGR
jgi:flagellar basal-body rod modification protein FlgD